MGVCYHYPHLVTDACGGQCTDRTLGTYVLQFTSVASPGSSTLDTGDALTGWQTVGSFECLFDSAVFDSYLRHRFEISLADGSPVMASALRVLFPGSGLAGRTAIDEIEIFGALAPEPVPASAPRTLLMVLLASVLNIIRSRARVRSHSTRATA